MKKILVMGLAATVLTTAVYAANELIMVNYQSIINSEQGKAKLDGSIKFIIGPNSKPAGATMINNVTINKISKGKSRSDFQGACNNVVLDSLVELQQKAKSEGANGVANIISSYHGTDNMTVDAAECHAGGTGGHLTLKADLVKLK